jgi:hypothetical protein
MTNETLERDVADELRWDPKIDSRGMAVSVDNGIVTLREGSFRQKREATVSSPHGRSRSPAACARGQNATRRWRPPGRPPAS